MEETKVLLDDSMFEKLDDSEKNTEFIAMESKTYLQDAWRCFKKNKLALGGLVFLSIMILLAIFVPMVSPYTYDAQDLDLRNALPSASHLLGTDKLGRDILVRLMFGARISLAVGFVAAFLNLIIGVVYGGISGFVGGKVDMVMMRIIDCIYSIPSMLYVILIMMVFGSNIGSVLLGICVSSWIGMARQVRTQVQTLKQQEFALAAYVIGAGKLRILFKHLIINCMGPIIVSTTLMVPEAIFTESFLPSSESHLPAPGQLGNPGQRGQIGDPELSLTDRVAGACHLPHRAFLKLYRRRRGRSAGSQEPLGGVPWHYWT